MIGRFRDTSNRSRPTRRILAGWTALALLCAPSGCERPAERPRPRPSESVTPLPRVDVHLHVAPDAADTALEILAEQHILVGLNASGGHPGGSLERSAELASSSGGRLLPLCTPHLDLLEHPEWQDYVSRFVAACRQLAGKGLKISKYLGLGLMDSAGRLVAVDDPRLDVLFDAAGKAGLPVLIHSGDPRAFFRPNTPDNERYAELRVHPGWSFHGLGPHGSPWPSWEQVLEQFERRVARHPGTVFVGAHFGNAAEEPERVARMLRAHPNYYVDTAARIPEFGRHPADRIRAFFVEFQDRILFGSDLGVGRTGLTLGSGGTEPGTRPQARTFFEAHWSYFESRQRGMAHPTPIQGDWTVDGIGLPRAVREKIYWKNADRVFSLNFSAHLDH